MKWICDNNVIDQYAKQLQRSGVTANGVAGKHLIRFAGAIPLDDLEQMKNAIDAECERVDEHEWSFNLMKGDL